MDQRICRRDFLNSTLLASGASLLGSLSPQQLLAKDDWTGYGGVGQYADSNGNTFEVMTAGHQIRNHVFESLPAATTDTNPPLARFSGLHRLEELLSPIPISLGAPDHRTAIGEAHRAINQLLNQILKD